MSYLITLGLVEIIYDPVVDRVKIVLVGATTIKREREFLMKSLMNYLFLMVHLLMMVLVLAVVVLLVQDNTKGLPLVDDVVSLSLRSLRNVM